jgi:hypothetical protein
VHCGSTRRQFLARAGGVLATLALPGLAEADAPPASPYRTRPDLAPPPVAVTTPARGTAQGLVFLAPQKGDGPLGPMIVDDDGELVWFHALDRTKTAANFGVQTHRGEPVLVWWEGAVVSGHGSGEYVIADASYDVIARLNAGNGVPSDLHELRLTPHGTALVTGYRTIPWDLTPIGGPADGFLLDSVAQEVDVATGTVLLDWRASDHVPLEESYAPIANGVLDLAHLNSVDLWDDDHLLVSARHTWTLYKVDRRTGAVVWRLGGKRNEFAVGDGASFSWQHHARRREDGTLTIFDNGNGPILQQEPASRGIRLHVDEQRRTVRLVEAHAQPDGLSANAEGSVQTLPDGGTFVGWGIVPAYSEFGPDGSLRLHATFAAGGSSYRAFRFAWSGRPRTKPTVVVDDDGGGQKLFVSWNGATDVTHWRVLTGATRRSLAARRVVRRTGFETRIAAPGGGDWVAVDALDARGRALGRSEPVKQL